LMSIPENDFLIELAHKYAKEFARVRVPSGPWIEFMGCIYGRVAVRVLDVYKTVR
ncbi:uncharacterized protein PHACADRAFT_65151, partial [Phanerochaete carnosa HHB-10118-sp]